MKKVYLDNAATTQLDPKVVDEMTSVLVNSFGNPSSTHFFGRDSKTIIELSRKFIAQTFNVKPSEIFFTSGGTESNNMIIKSCIKFGVERIITTKIEHKAVLNPILNLCSNSKIELEYLNVDSDGYPDLNRLKSLLSKQQKTLVSLMHINNEIGTMIDLDEIGNICNNPNTLFHSDTVQTIGHFPLDLSSINIDFLTCSAHKFHGPKGVGFVYINEKNKAFPLIEGGEQERGMRGGTESTHNIYGLKVALEEAYKNLYLRTADGIKPGLETSDFLDKVMSLITFPGSIFLALISVLPAVIVALMQIQQGWALFYGGTSLLIMVGVAIDTIQQINAYLLNRHYDGLMKTGKTRRLA